MPTLHLLCGKAASGKSTLAANLGREPGTFVVSEDRFLAGLYDDQLQTLTDYVRLSAKLRDTLAPHIVDLLGAGVSVVLDFPANTRDTRRWMRTLIDASGADHTLHWLDVPDDTAKARLTARNASGTHPFSVNEAQMDRLLSHFDPPAPDEGFTVIRHAND